MTRTGYRPGLVRLSEFVEGHPGLSDHPGLIFAVWITVLHKPLGELSAVQITVRVPIKTINYLSPKHECQRQ